MFPRHLDIDLAFESFNVSAVIPLAPLEKAFEALKFRNAEARARDADPELRPCLRVRVRCLHCDAPIFQLTAVEREGELLRACRCCRAEFPLGA